MRTSRIACPSSPSPIQDRVLRDRAYAEKVAVRLLDYLMRIDEVRGAGRLYVP